MENLRNELKFRVREADLKILGSRLRLLLSPDSHEVSERGYFIRSVYFDDIDFSAYFDKLSGISERTKYRIRTYNYSDNYIVLEKKEKIGNLTKKTQSVISKEVFENLCTGKAALYTESNDTLLREFAVKSISSKFEPSVVVDYYRKTFVSDVSKTRITFDTKLSAGSFSLGDYFSPESLSIPVNLDDEATLEVKFDVFLLPQIKDALYDIPKIRCSNSKYCKCAEALYWSMR